MRMFYVKRFMDNIKVLLCFYLDFFFHAFCLFTHIISISIIQQICMYLTTNIYIILLTLEKKTIGESGESTHKNTSSKYS